jgi:uncharacterized membrane protein YdbT with pleckstrin-like domain
VTYVESTLGKGEEIRYLAQLSYWPFSGRILLGFALLTLPWFGLPWWTVVFGLSVFSQIYLRLESVELAVTNRRIIVKTGLVQRKTSELYLNRVEGVEVEQSAQERMMGYGTVNIRGVGTEIAPVAHISNPLAFRKAFFAAADEMMGQGDPNGPFGGRISSKQESADESRSR